MVRLRANWAAVRHSVRARLRSPCTNCPHQVRDDGANAPFVLSSRPLPRFATVEDAARNVSTILACGLPHKKHPSPQGNVPCGEGLLWKKVACALFHHCFLHLVGHADYVYAGRQLDVARRAAIDYAAACVIDNGRGFRAQNVQHAIRAAYAEQVAGGRAQGGRVLQSEGGRKRNVLGYADGAPGVGVAVAPLHEHVAIVGGRLDVGFRAVVVYAITQHAAHVLAPVGHVERYDTFFRRPYGIERYGAVVPVSVVSRFAVLQMEAVHLVACVLPQGIAVCPDGLSPCGGCHGMLQLPGYFAGGELFRGVCFGLRGHVVAVVAACGSAC